MDALEIPGFPVGVQDAVEKQAFGVDVGVPSPGKETPADFDKVALMVVAQGCSLLCGPPRGKAEMIPGHTGGVRGPGCWLCG